MYQYYCTCCKDTFLENELTDNDTCPRCGDDGMWEREIIDPTDAQLERARDLHDTLEDICRAQLIDAGRGHLVKP
jgi:hypothetical protein